MQSLPVLSNANLIGTRERPLRASAIPDFLICPGKVILTEEYWGMSYGGSDGGETAAQTGSLVHHAAEAFHRGGDGRKAIESFSASYPQADVQRAIRIFSAYAEDPKNRDAKVIRIEEKIMMEIPPDPTDPTGLPVVIRGTLDQVREEPDGRRTVWDIKTGKTYFGTKALNHYVAQQAIYTLASGVDVGGLICTDGYFRKPVMKVHWRYKLSLDDMKQFLPIIAREVAAARRGQLSRVPGDHCEWCIHKEYATCSDYMRSHSI